MICGVNGRSLARYRYRFYPTKSDFTGQSPGYTSGQGCAEQKVFPTGRQIKGLGAMN